jgi:plastocyanin
VKVEPGKPAARREKREFDWQSLAEAGVWSLVLAGVATMVFVIEGVSDPGLPITLVVMLVGLALTTRDRKAGPIVLLITSGFLLLIAGFFAFQVFLVPQSTLYFVVNVVFVVAGICTLLASTVLVRGGEKSSNSAAKRAAVSAGSLIGLLTIVALLLRIGYEEPPSNSGDISISANDNEFIPDRVDAGPGRVTVVVENEDFSIHTFSIEHLDVSQYLPGGVRSEVVFQADPGTYEYFCEIPGHEEMKGTLRIR